METQAKMIHIPLGMKKIIEKLAKEKGISEHAYIMFAVAEKIEEDKKNGWKTE